VVFCETHIIISDYKSFPDDVCTDLRLLNG
jgi:hypothetical protein